MHSSEVLSLLGTALVATGIGHAADNYITAYSVSFGTALVLIALVRGMAAADGERYWEK